MDFIFWPDMRRAALFLMTRPLGGRFFLPWIAALCLLAAVPTLSLADEAQEPEQSWLDSLDWGLSGYLKLRGGVSWPDEHSVFEPVGLAPLGDGFVELRLMNTIHLGQAWTLETHYDLVLSGGSTRDRGRELARRYPMLFPEGVSTPVDDRTRLLDLTATLGQTDELVTYHRLDRLALTWAPDFATFRIGRQAVTWGNGLVFNPMDLFNPFSPTDIERDYKVGDDMALAMFSLEKIGEFELLYVPRRDPEQGRARWDESSLAAKWHFSSGETEFDLMGARHYTDWVIGLGSRGYLGDAAWRLDATWTFLEESTRSMHGYLSLVANLDYSWIWWDKNFYGYIELYYNGLGLGANEYSRSYTDEPLAQRLARGELYAAGRWYAAAQINVELHPLLNAYLGTIANLQDPSGVLQPRLVWSVDQDVELILGANILWGGQDTEYGGFSIPGTDLENRSPNSVYCWLTWYF